jgi:hypothetical protein
MRFQAAILALSAVARHTILAWVLAILARR